MHELGKGKTCRGGGCRHWVGLVDCSYFQSPGSKSGTDGKASAGGNGKVQSRVQPSDVGQGGAAMRRKRLSGATIGEAVVVLSIFSILYAYAATGYLTTKRRGYVVQCQSQLQEIGFATVQYRLKHNGRNPWPIGVIATEGYINEHTLVCPGVKSMAYTQVVKAQTYVKSKNRPPWSSYFMYSQRGLDLLAQQGRAAFSYSEIFEKRKGETPLVVCRNHREDQIFHGSPHWYFPEDPLLILRFDGNVSTTRQGGAKTDHTWSGNEQDLVTL